MKNQGSGRSIAQTLCRLSPEATYMSDPLDKATSKAPATLGEGCLSRYDPEDMTPEDGTEFPGAAELWDQLKPDAEAPAS